LRQGVSGGLFRGEAAKWPACHKIARLCPQSLNAVGRERLRDLRCRHHNRASPRGGFPWNARFRTSKEVNGRVTSRSENSTMPACPLHHSKACPQRHGAQPGHGAGGLETRCEWARCLPLGIGIASSFASSGVLPKRMGRSTSEPGAQVCGWAVRGMRSAVLLPWRRWGGAVRASGLRCRCRLRLASAMPNGRTDDQWNWATRCTGLRAIATIDSRGHVHCRQRSQQSDKLERRLHTGLKAGAPNIA
jgi:hypothetical protein